MSQKIIQEQFGEAIIKAIREFAQKDMETAEQLETKYFSHVSDEGMRRALAETLYGARWIYKLGLALLVRDNEQLAHVRAQVIDYGSVCEGLLLDAIRHAFSRNLMAGNKYRFSNTRHLTGALTWSPNAIDSTLSRQSFHWLIDVAEDEGIIPASLAIELHALRKERNTVHAKSRTYQAFLGTSMRAFETMRNTVTRTRTWKHAHI